MLRAILRLSKGYRLAPWRSPYLLWRIETYSGLYAERITARDFWTFVRQHPGELLRFLRWAGQMHSDHTAFRVFTSVAKKL
jgi:hypothetical protein